MPNHVTNGVSIHHDDSKKLKELKTKLIKEVEEKDYEGNLTGETFTQFDFNAVVPAPENIEKDGCSGEHKNGVVCWYEWNIENWGTKWNAYSVSIIKEDDNNLHVQFDTAWSPPTPIFSKLEEMGFTVSAASINEDDGVDPDYFGEDQKFYVDRTLEFFE